MLNLKRLTETFAVSAELRVPADFVAARTQGFTTLIGLLPETESGLASAAAARAAERAGLRFVHMPAPKYDVFTDDTVEAMRAALAGATGPVLATCASGQRAAIVWAAAQARGGQAVDGILDHLARAGFDLAFLRDDLEAQAHAQQWLAAPAAAPKVALAAA